MAGKRYEPLGPRAIRTLQILLAVAFVVSVIHYSDNYFNYHDFPQSKTLPNPSLALVLWGWIVFTSDGLAGYIQLRRRGPSTLALGALAFYSASGIIGIGHYAVPGAFDMPWWRQLHVCLDISSGTAVLAWVLWAERNRRPAASLPGSLGVTTAALPERFIRSD